MDKVIVETTATLKEVAEEVTDLLSEAGINAFVYLENKWTF